MERAEQGGKVQVRLHRNHDLFQDRKRLPVNRRSVMKMFDLTSCVADVAAGLSAVFF